MWTQKAINILGKYWKKLISFGAGLTGLLVLLGIIDYFAKWGIANFLFNCLFKIWLVFKPYINILFLLWLSILTFFFIKQNIEKRREQPSGINKMTMSKITKTLEERFKKFIDSDFKIRSFEINSKFDDINNRLFDIERKNLISSIDDDLVRGRVAIGSMIELLGMDIKKGWEWRIHEDLKMIRDYLEKYKIISQHSADLIKQLDCLGREYEKIIKEIKDLIAIA